MRRRSLWPREHGAYAQLGAPLVSALALRTPTLAAFLIASAACFAFLANEPLLVVLGQRGPRMREIDGRRAVIRLAVLSIGAVLAGTVGLVLAPQASVACGLVAIGAAVMLTLAWRRAEHSIAGELVAAIVLPGAAAPVAVASGVSWPTAAILWVAWSFGYACSVVGVHRVIARHKQAASWTDATIVTALATAMIVSCVLVVQTPATAVALPLVAIATLLAIHPPAATRLRAIGVALVVASMVSSSLAIVII